MNYKHNGVYVYDATTNTFDLVVGSGLTFEGFTKANLARCEAKNGFNHSLHDWSPSDWMVATLGELGEAANLVKKLNRVRDGIRGNKENEYELRAKLKRELGDFLVYGDLTCSALGWTMESCMVETWNAKSLEIGYPTL